MKRFYKCALSFMLGAVLSAFTISLFLPETVTRHRIYSGSSITPWTFHAIDAINFELPKLINNPNLTFAVIPSNSGMGYSIVGFDTRLRARFRMTNWDNYFNIIDARMDELRDEK